MKIRIFLSDCTSALQEFVEGVSKPSSASYDRRVGCTSGQRVGMESSSWKVAHRGAYILNGFHRTGFGIDEHQVHCSIDGQLVAHFAMDLLVLAPFLSHGDELQGLLQEPQCQNRHPQSVVI